MPDAILVQVAKEITDRLNNAAAGTFNQKFDAIRSYADWELPLEESAPDNLVMVDVTPVPTLPMDIETRGSRNYEPSVDVIVRRRITPAERNQDGTLNLDVQDELVLFMQQIAEFFTPVQLTCGARWKETDPRRAFIPKHLHDYGQFTGIVRFTFDMPDAI